VAPYLETLRKRSAERIATEREYDYIREDIEQYKKLQADKSISLNEAQRLKEKEEIDARQKGRERERLARKDPDEKVFEISLKQAEQPGLPAPVTKTNFAARASTPVYSTGGTNLAANLTSSNLTATATLDPGTSTDDGEEEKAPPADAALREAEHILFDYINALPKGNIVTAGNKPDDSIERKD